MKWKEKFYFGNVKYKTDKDTINPKWDNVSVKYHYSFIETAILKYLNFVPSSILDVGSGAGHWLQFYTELFHDCDIEGIDISSYNISNLERKYKVYLASIENFCSGSYDVINAIGVLHHILDGKRLDKAIQNIKSLVKTDGIVFIGTSFEQKKERLRKFRSVQWWNEHLTNNGLYIYVIESPAKSVHIKEHLSLMVVKKS